MAITFHTDLEKSSSTERTTTAVSNENALIAFSKLLFINLQFRNFPFNSALVSFTSRPKINAHNGKSYGDKTYHHINLQCLSKPA